MTSPYLYETLTYSKARQRELLEAAQRERIISEVRRSRVWRRRARRWSALFHAVADALRAARRLGRDMAAVDTGHPVPTLRDYPLAPQAGRPRRASSDC